MSFPETIPDYEMDTLIKEWMLVGYTVSDWRDREGDVHSVWVYEGDEVDPTDEAEYFNSHKGFWVEITRACDEWSFKEQPQDYAERYELP
jgi:hypothetical protein